MLLKVGVAIMLVSVTLAVGVASVVVHQNEETEAAGRLVGFRAAAVEEAVDEDKEQRKFDPGKKLEIDDEPASVPESPQATSSEEVDSADATRYDQPPDTSSRQSLEE